MVEFGTTITFGFLVSFLAGGFPSGYLIGKWKGMDVRNYGSGNIGSTNVLRLLGMPYGVLCFVLDAGKGPLIIYLLSQFLVITENYILVLYGVAVLLGNIFCPYLNFKGGKGVATALGVFLYLMPYPSLIAAGVWGTTLLISKISSVSSLAGVLTFWIASFVFAKSPVEWGVATFAALLIIIRHKDNIKRLLSGSEKSV